MTLEQDYTRAMELARADVAKLSRQVEIGENHLRQLRETVAMNKRHLRDASDHLAEMETLYAKWQGMTANVK